MGDPAAVNATGGGGKSPLVGGKLDGGTGAVGIMGKGGMFVVDVGTVGKPWFMSRNFLAFIKSSEAVEDTESDFFLFFGVEGRLAPLAAASPVAFALLASVFRFLDFFLVGGVLCDAPDPGIPMPSWV